MTTVTLAAHARRGLIRQDRGLPFYRSVQHVKNTKMLLQCEECGQWKWIYAEKQLTCTQKHQLERVRDHISFSCGMHLQDYSDLPQDMMDTVFTFYKKSRLQWTNIKAVLFSVVHRHLHILLIREWVTNTDELSKCESCSEKSKIPNAKVQRKKLTFYYFVSGIWSCYN